MARLFNARRFCQERRVPYWTEGYKQCRPGWIQLDCPFCVGNPGPHLGYDEREGYFNCWRCGSHSVLEVIRTFAHVRIDEARMLMEQYSGRVLTPERKVAVKRRRECKLPAMCGKLRAVHKQYLRQRNFDPAKLESLWALHGTLGAGPYKLRIIAPIYATDGRMVSYQGRDVTDKQQAKYKACAQEREAEEHKRHLYGQWLVRDNWIVVVEGVTDVWRLGPGAVGTFGIKYKAAQVKRMKRYAVRFILFDHTDPQARKQSAKLADALSVFPGHTYELDIADSDPASMSQHDADALMADLRKTARSLT